MTPSRWRTIQRVQVNAGVGVQVGINPSPPTRIVMVEEARDSVEVKVVVTAAIEIDERSLVINADAAEAEVAYLVGAVVVVAAAAAVVVIVVITVIEVEAIVESGDGGKDTIVETVEGGTMVQIAMFKTRSIIEVRDPFRTQGRDPGQD